MPYCPGGNPLTPPSEKPRLPLTILADQGYDEVILVLDMSFPDHAGPHSTENREGEGIVVDGGVFNRAAVSPWPG